MPKFLKSSEKEDNKEKPSRIKKFLKGEEKKKESSEDFIDIEYEVMKILGRPKDFLKTEVKTVGNNRYRVNVVCIKHFENSIVPDIYRPKSYYISLINNKIESNPVIQKCY